MIAGFDNNFDGVLIDADLKYQKKKKKYGESWKNMAPHELRGKLFEELGELTASKKEDKYGESVDVVIVSLMLAKRIRETTQ